MGSIGSKAREANDWTADRGMRAHVWARWSAVGPTVWSLPAGPIHLPRAAVGACTPPGQSTSSSRTAARGGALPTGRRRSHPTARGRWHLATPPLVG
jgi:hypothetical protein